MIDFDTYTSTHLKASIIGFFGVILLLVGAFVGLMHFKYFFYIFFPFFVLGGGLLYAAVYGVQKLSFDRENEGARVYHYKGKFR